MGKRTNNFSFNWYGMLPKFGVEGLAQHNDVFSVGVWTLRKFAAPKLHAFEVVEASACPYLFMLFCTEVDCAREDALKTLDEPPVVDAIGWQPEFVKYLSSSGKAYLARATPYGLSRNPNRYKTILPIRQPESGMTTDLKEKSSVAALVNESARWWSPDREPAQEEWSRVEEEVLLPLAPLLANQLDGFHPLHLLARQAQVRVHLRDRLDEFSDVFHRIRTEAELPIRRWSLCWAASINRAAELR